MQVHERRLGHLKVVVDQVSLGDPALREEDLARVRDPHLAAGCLDQLIIGDGRQDAAYCRA